VRAFLSNAPIEVVWTSATDSENESFWPSFCSGLRHAVPKAAKAIAELRQLGFPYDQARISEALKILGRISFAGKTVLVFDDCHLLPRSFVGFCEGMAAGVSLNVGIVAITRHAWGGGQPLANILNNLSRLDKSLFALNPTEIIEYFALNGVTVNQKVALELHGSTEGWISALYLCLLGHKQNGHFSAVADDISSRMREMVYDPLSERAKELLLALTPLERFTTAQAIHLCGSDAPAILDELTSKNAFLSFDAARQVYSPHAIFRHLLMAIFEEGTLPPDRRKEIYSACGDELMAAGELASAMWA
jgi:LuxR family maltose regulon positive regulatory protein